MGQARFSRISLTMKLFRRGDTPARSAGAEAVAAAPVLPTVVPARREISLTSEQRSILEKPVDPRVDRILEDVYADKTAAETALNMSRDSGKRQVIQDQSGLWRIVPDSAPQEPISLLDAL